MGTANRFTSGANQDNTLRTVTQDFQNPAYAATISSVFTAQQNTFMPGDLTGALTWNVGVGTATTAPFPGDRITAHFTSTPGATVTFGTGLKVTAATLVLPATKTGSIEFIFNGTSWCESNRAITV